MDQLNILSVTRDAFCNSFGEDPILLQQSDWKPFLTFSLILDMWLGPDPQQPLTTLAPLSIQPVRDLPSKLVAK